jgi:hypothetical protein
VDRKRENLVEKCGRGKKTRGMETKEKGKNYFSSPLSHFSLSLSLSA